MNAMSDERNEVEDLFSGGGAPAFQFGEVGAKVGGTITRIQVMDERDFTSGQVLTWSDGKPKRQVVLTVAVSDDEEWRVFVKGHLFTAMKDALVEAGATQPEVGGTIAVEHHALGEQKQKGLNKPKLFKVRYKAPERPASDDLDGLF